MTEAAVSFAGNLTDDPEVRYTDGGIARATFRVAVLGRGSRSRRSSLVRTVGERLTGLYWFVQLG
jgi:single-stranded DNA-binding protein